MKIVQTFMVLASIALSQAAIASDAKYEEGEKLYKTNCSACHGATGGMDMTKRIAPPIAAVRMHYIDSHPDEKSFVQAVTSWVEKQDEAKSLMRGAIQKFKIMPQLSVKKEDAEKIATYIYAGDIEKPEGFEQHVKEEHGKMGMGKDMQDGHGKGHGKGMHHGKGEGKHKMQGSGTDNHNEQDMKGMAGMHKMMQGQEMDHQKDMAVMHEKMQSGMHKMRMKHGKRGGMSNKMMRKLNLSEQQKKQVKALIAENKKRLKPVKREMKEINKTLRKLDTQSPEYKAQVFSLADAKAKRVHQMIVEKGETRMKIEAIFTAEQRAKFNKMRQKRQQHKGSKHGS